MLHFRYPIPEFRHSLKFYGSLSILFSKSSITLKCWKSIACHTFFRSPILLFNCLKICQTLNRILSRIWNSSIIFFEILFVQIQNLIEFLESKWSSFRLISQTFFWILTFIFRPNSLWFKKLTSWKKRSGFSLSKTKLFCCEVRN